MKANLKSENLLIYQETLIDYVSFDLSDLEFKGAFGKKILFLSSSLAAKNDEQTLLDKMIQATGLTYDDLYHYEQSSSINLLVLINKLKPKQVICFGNLLDTHSVKFSKRLYKTQQINDFQLLMAHDLTQINNATELKQSLWNGLKKMFAL